MLLVRSDLEAPDVTKADLIGLIRDLKALDVIGDIARKTQVPGNELDAWERGERPGAGFSRFIAECALGGSASPPVRAALVARGIPPPTYDLRRNFEENAYQGPTGAFSPTSLTSALGELRVRIRGLPLNFPLGIPACALTLNARWIGFYAHKGFDLVTFKTVRSAYREPHPSPNWVIVRDAPRISAQDLTNPFALVAAGDENFLPDDPSSVTTANSFGIPSDDPGTWMLEVKRAKDYLVDGQILVVSVVGNEYSTREALIRDFVEVALMARQAGADIVELNLSCPNTFPAQGGDIYRDPQLAGEIARSVRAALKDTPVLAKIGYLTAIDMDKLVASTQAHVDGYVAINTVAMPVARKSGGDFFGPTRNVHTGAEIKRPQGGVSGAAIRGLALDAVRSLATIRARNGSGFTIVGVGGVMAPGDVFELLRAGADAVQSCTGALFNADLAINTRQLVGSEWMKTPEARAEHNRLGVVRSKILLRLLDGPADLEVIQGAVQADLVPSGAEIGWKLGRLLRELREEGLVYEDGEVLHLTKAAREQLENMRKVLPVELGTGG